MEILIYSPAPPHLVDGVGLHCRRLAEELRALGDHVDLAHTLAELPDRTYDVVHMHYVPFLYPGWGVGSLPQVAALRKRGAIVVTVHEARVAYEWNARSIVFATLQRSVLRVLLKNASRTIITTDRWVRALGAMQVVVIPAGSPLPRDAVPKVDFSDPIVVGMIGGGHEGRMPQLAAAVCLRVQESLGAEAICIGESMHANLSSTGYLADDAFATALARLDLVFLPYRDGVSGRRTSFLGALQLGVPILTTMVNGSTDFSDTTGWAYTEPDRESEYLEESLRLAEDSDQRSRLASAAREIFETTLSWRILAARIRREYEKAA